MSPPIEGNMTTTESFLTTTLLAGALILSSACSNPRVETPAAPDHSTMTREQHNAMHPDPADSSFAEMQKRGQMAMGVDQYASAHHFEVTPDGGRIELQNNLFDSLAVAQIRAHMKLIQHAFQAGDFSTPAFVHMRDMPGTRVMTRKKALISYEYEELPRGGAVRITTNDIEARGAIAEFLKAQSTEHRSQ
jgi:hypothetical protein